MDVATMAYVAVVIGGVSLQSPEAVPMETCTALRAQYPQTLCIDVEPACGKGEAEKCLGRADLDVKPAIKPRPKKKHTAYRYRRKAANQSVGQILAGAL